MDEPFLMDSTSSIAAQSLGKIAQCTPAVDEKMWCFLPAGCRSGKLSVLYFLTCQKSGFSPHRGYSLHRCTSQLAMPAGTCVRLAVKNLTSIATGGVGIRPQNIKNFHFLVKSLPVGRHPWPISKIFSAFIRLTMLR